MTLERAKTRYIVDLGADARPEQVQYLSEAFREHHLEEFLVIGGGNIAIHDLETGQTLQWAPPPTPLEPLVVEQGPYVPRWLILVLIVSCLLAATSLLLAISAIIHP